METWMSVQNQAFLNRTKHTSHKKQVADAFEIFILSVIGSFVACEWTMYTWENALLTSIVFVGIAIGSPVLGTIADIYGRKKALISSMGFLFLFGAVSGASPSYVWMLIFRGCMGFALGGLSQGLTLCTEYCPADMRGKAGLFLCYFWSVGTCGIILLTWIVMKYLNSWRLLLVIVSVPCLIAAISTKWYPESARYLLVCNKYEKALSILENIAKTNRKSLPDGKLDNAVYEEKRGRLSNLLSKEYRLSTILFWYMWLSTAFAYYGIALVSPRIIESGSILDVVNGSKSLDEANMSNIIPCAQFNQDTYINLLWTSAAEFPGLLFFTFLVERVNRKIILSGACISGSVLTLMLLLRTNKIFILLILFAARGIILSVFQLTFVVTSETYPTAFRAVAMGFASAFCRIGGLIVPYVAQVLVIHHPIVAMSLMAGVLFLGGVAAMFLPFETRGVAMKEMYTEYVAPK